MVADVTYFKALSWYLLQRLNKSVKTNSKDGWQPERRAKGLPFYLFYIIRGSSNMLKNNFIFCSTYSEVNTCFFIELTIKTHMQV